MKSKKLFRITILMLCTISLFGCGKKNSHKNDNPESGEALRSTNDILNSRRQDEEKKDKNYRNSNHKRYSTDSTTWFEKQGLRLTPCGDFKMVVGGSGSPREIDASAVIHETTDNCEDGYKNVIGTLTINYNTNASFWFSAFDKYNGISFEVANDPTTYGHPDKGLKTLRIGEEDVDLAIEFKKDHDDKYYYYTITVTCPVEYDGTVFQYGYYESSMEDSSIDFESYQYTISDTPFYGDGLYNYFSYIP